MKRAPEIHFVVVDPKGKAVEGAKIIHVNPPGLDNSLSSQATSDKSGQLTVPYPAQGVLASFEITHKSGRATIVGKDLAKPVVITEDGQPKQIIRCEVRLLPTE
jgi:hypothetical protein